MGAEDALAREMKPVLQASDISCRYFMGDKGEGNVLMGAHDMRA